MKRLVASGALALSVGIVPAASSHTIQGASRNCGQLFTVHMGVRAGEAIYAGTQHVGLHKLRVLGYIERCQIEPLNQRKVRAFDHRQRALWVERKQAARAARLAAQNPTPDSVLASYYDDAGGTACGFHATYGVANKTLPCGSHVTFRFEGRTVTATVEDRGPFVAGRSYDLNTTLKDALGCPDLCGEPYSPRLMASTTG